METSARSGQNVKPLFNELAKNLTGIDTNPMNDHDEPRGIVLDGKNNGANRDTDGKGKKKKNCCK